jgi:3-hydroxy-9,10-secoandrosta-1,3,5(10)-triene-9,17-dione monooxygenase reductase component
VHVDAAAFRTAIGQFPTGVTVVTALDGARPQGITVNALASVSLDPPLVMVALDRRRFIVPAIRDTGRYAVSILPEGQEALSDCFAGADVTPGRDDFCGARWRPGESGLPLLDVAIATLECTVVAVHAVGDHDLFIGRVDACTVHHPRTQPLLYYRRHYFRVERGVTTPVAGKPEHRAG